METKTTLDDIVFEHRNQAYGAYDLRKSYPIALRNALLIGSLLFLLLFLLPTIFAHLRPQIKYSYREVIIEKLPPPVDEKKEPVLPPPPVEKPQVNMVRNLPPEILTEVENETPPPPVRAFENAVSGPETVEGNDELEIVAPPEDAAPDAKTTFMEVEPETLGFNTVEIQPQFPGGMEELARFIGKNLRYPSNAAKAGVQGKVYVSFTVQTDGSISDVMALKGIGFGCDEEALRVLRAMPAWKPGSQSGRRVRVKFNMPIAFTLQD